MRRALAVTGGVALVLLAAGALLAWNAWRSLYAPMPVPADGMAFEVRAGSSLAGVTERLAEEGLIEHPYALRMLATLRGDAGRIKAGEYRIAPGTSPRALLEQLVQGRVVLHAITLIEGWTYRQALEALAGHDALEHTLAPDISGEVLLARIERPGQHPEGRFFPDTYRFARGTSDVALLQRAYDTMAQHLAEVWASRAPGLPLETPEALLTLASIVERETALAEERARIAGVFVRRLERGMRLQSDPTVIYGLGDSFDGDIRTRDLRTDTPYNTYTRHGLPPSPIALPGLGSLRAAASPEPGDALYFVATGAADGSHAFSATLEEHNRAVRRYLERLAEGRP